MKGVNYMSNKPIYDTLDCMRLIKKKYPWIPICVIRRVLFAEELYMHKIGIIDWLPDLNAWHYKKKQGLKAQSKIWVFSLLYF